MSRWQEIVREELHKAGPTRADKREAMKRASRIYHGSAAETTTRRNPTGGSGWLLFGLSLGGLILVANIMGRQKPSCPACIGS